MSTIKLSPSTLNLFNDCPACFWLDKIKKIKRPRGIFPSLPGGMDRVIKKYFDECRAEEYLPIALSGEVTANLFPNQPTLNKWRNWRASSLFYEDQELQVKLSGALDDCLLTEDGCHIPLDYKTRGSRMKESPVEYSKKYYQTQLDCYTLMLEASGFKTNGIAYLVYYWPAEAMADGIFQFHVESVLIETNIESAKEIIKKAVELLNEPVLPGWAKTKATSCEYCNLVKVRGGK